LLPNKGKGDKKHQYQTPFAEKNRHNVKIQKSETRVKGTQREQIWFGGERFAPEQRARGNPENGVLAPVARNLGGSGGSTSERGSGRSDHSF